MSTRDDDYKGVAVATLVHMPQASVGGNNARGNALAQRIASFDARAEDASDKIAALALGIVDALLVADAAALETALASLRERVARADADEPDTALSRGGLLALLSTTRWALERLPSPDEIALQRDTLALRLLTVLADGRAHANGELLERLSAGQSQLSRVGHQLLDQGLVVQRRIGRHVQWEATPRGQRALELSEGRATQASADAPRRRRRQPPRQLRAGGSVAAPARPAATALLVKRTIRTSGTAAAVRVVRPHPAGHWCVAMPSGRRAIARFTRKAEAVRRGREIVARAGGGVLHVEDLDGTVRRTTVERERRP